MDTTESADGDEESQTPIDTSTCERQETPPPIAEIDISGVDESRRRGGALRRSDPDDSALLLKIVQDRIDNSSRRDQPSGRTHGATPAIGIPVKSTTTSTIATPSVGIPAAKSIASSMSAANSLQGCPLDEDCLKTTQRVGQDDVVGAVAVSSRNSNETTATELLFENSANWTHSSAEDLHDDDDPFEGHALAIAAEVAPEMLDLERSLTERIRSEILAEEAMRSSGSICISTIAEVIHSNPRRPTNQDGRKRQLQIGALACCVVVVISVALVVGLLASTRQKESVFPPDDTILAYVPETICYERIPFLGRSEICPPQPQGSGATQVVAESRLWSVPEAQISVLNAGEVRIDLPQGNLTMGHAWELLPYYDNELVIIHLKGNKLINAMERGIQKLFDDQAAADTSLNSTTPSGAYPYGAGIRWNVNMTQSFPHRLYDIQVNPRLEGAWEPIQLHKTYSIVTNSYLAGGGDSYHEFSSAEEEHVVHTGLYSLESFVDYCETHELLIEPPREYFSTQTYIHSSVLFEMSDDTSDLASTPSPNRSRYFL